MNALKENVYNFFFFFLRTLSLILAILRCEGGVTEARIFFFKRFFMINHALLCVPQI